MKRILAYIIHWLKAKRKGHGVHSPFVYRLCEEVFYNDNGFYAFEKLAQVRKELLIDRTLIRVNDLGAGSRRFKGEFRTVSDICTHGISTEKQSKLLFRLIHHLCPENVIEMGTSLGLNTLYLSEADHETPVITLEGSTELSAFAKRLFEKHMAKNIRIIQGNFDDTLPILLEEISRPGFVYMDGNHRYDATLRYFNLIAERASEHTVIVLDDIYWSKKMQKAWKEIRNDSRVSLSIDTFWMGIIFFRKEHQFSEHFRLLI